MYSRDLLLIFKLGQFRSMTVRRTNYICKTFHDELNRTLGHQTPVWLDIIFKTSEIRDQLTQKLEWVFGKNSEMSDIESAKRNLPRKRRGVDTKDPQTTEGSQTTNTEVISKLEPSSNQKTSEFFLEAKCFNEILFENGTKLNPTQQRDTDFDNIKTVKTTLPFFLTLQRE